MKSNVLLESKDVKAIIAKFLGVKPENVIQTRYSFSVVGMTAEEIADKLNDD